MLMRPIRDLKWARHCCLTMGKYWWLIIRRMPHILRDFALNVLCCFMLMRHIPKTEFLVWPWRPTKKEFSLKIQSVPAEVAGRFYSKASSDKTQQSGCCSAEKKKWLWQNRLQVYCPYPSIYNFTQLCCCKQSQVSWVFEDVLRCESWLR